MTDEAEKRVDMPKGPKPCDPHSMHFVLNMTNFGTFISLIFKEESYPSYSVFKSTFITLIFKIKNNCENNMDNFKL